MSNRCDHLYEQTPDVPEPDTVDGPQRSLPSDSSAEQLTIGTPHVGISRLRPQDPLEVPSTTITRRGPPGLTAQHPAC
ncbi:hypothetical protein Trydic_g989 [Trypoxylus dichotomus]